MAEFVFKNFAYNKAKKQASFSYQAGPGLEFTEKITFTQAQADYDAATLEKALFLAFVLIGTSYYKTFPTAKVRLAKGGLDAWRVDFFNRVYQEGLSQFAFEDKLTRTDLAQFSAAQSLSEPASDYQTTDPQPLVLQSGGKDSLLLAKLLEESGRSYTPWFLQNTNHHPKVLETLAYPLTLAQRKIDSDGLAEAEQKGARNGHVPVTYIVLSVAIVQAILLGKDTVIAAIGNEGEEPHAWIDDLPVAHQWSKTWLAEQKFAEYVTRYISPKLHVGSALRRYSELKIAELFVEHAWEKYAQEFSSCNIANYLQGVNNERLQWCGNCPKCANSFLLFAPFVVPGELIAVFNGENLFLKDSLQETFKGLLGVDGVMKPFECVGEVGELQQAYHMAHANFPDEYTLPFKVPTSDFDYNKEHPHQADFAIV